MLSFSAKIQNEYESAYDLSLKKQFTKPKIYNAKGDLSKRWYVYFSYRNPETGKLKRMKNIYGKANRYQTKEERYSVLNVYKKRLHKLLREGYNPFEDNTELHRRKTERLKKTEPKKEVKDVVPVKEKKIETAVSEEKKRKPQFKIDETFEKIINSLTIIREENFFIVSNYWSSISLAVRGAYCRIY